MKDFIRRHEILTYLLLTFIFAWSIIFTLLSRTDADMSSPGIGVILGGWLLGFAPCISAFIVTYLTTGNIKKSRIISSFKQKCTPKLYLLSLVIVPLYTLLTILLTHLFISPYKVQITPGLIALGLTWGIFSALGEEPGWRGYLLPRLFEKYTVLQSALITGVIWAVWHFPMNYMDYRFYGNYMPVFMLITSINLILDALIITGLFIKGNASLRLSMLYHYTLTGTTILQAGIFQPVNASYTNSSYSNLIGFAVKIIIAAVLFYTIRKDALILKSRKFKQLKG